MSEWGYMYTIYFRMLNGEIGVKVSGKVSHFFGGVVWQNNVTLALATQQHTVLGVSSHPLHI